MKHYLGGGGGAVKLNAKVDIPLSAHFKIFSAFLLKKAMNVVVLVSGLNLHKKTCFSQGVEVIYLLAYLGKSY